MTEISTCPQRLSSPANLAVAYEYKLYVLIQDFLTE